MVWHFVRHPVYLYLALLIFLSIVFLQEGYGFPGHIFMMLQWVIFRMNFYMIKVVSEVLECMYINTSEQIYSHTFSYIWFLSYIPFLSIPFFVTLLFVCHVDMGHKDVGLYTLYFIHQF